MNKKALIKDLNEVYNLVSDHDITEAMERIEFVIREVKQLHIQTVVSSAFLVQHKETLINYGLFSTRKKAENYINKNTDLFGIQEVKIA